MTKENNNGANLGFESELWRAADALRSNMDAAEYKHVVLGLIFLKYISDAFEEQHTKLEADRAQGADPEDPDEYRAVNIFWVPKEARCSHLKANAKQPTIGKTIDDAMLAIERDNPSLKSVLPKDYAHPRLDKQRLGQLIDMVGNIGLGDKANRSKDILGRVYEYFLSQFASGEGEIRKNIIEADLVDCMVALPGQLFYSTQIPVYLWFIARDKKNGSFRDRRGQTLFIDARKLGTMIDRVHRELTEEDICKIADTYHAWRLPESARAGHRDRVGGGVTPAVLPHHRTCGSASGGS
jgi:type I restriction-modification system DNA methylase subunit